MSQRRHAYAQAPMAELAISSRCRSPKSGLILYRQFECAIIQAYSRQLSGCTLSLMKFHLCQSDGRIAHVQTRECVNEVEMKTWARNYLRLASPDMDAVEVWNGDEIVFRIRRHDLKTPLA